MGGRHVFMGYLNDPANTAAAIDAEGFICTGDVGQVDKFGLIFITGRLKVTTREKKTMEKLVLHLTMDIFLSLFAGNFDHGRWRERGSCFDREQH
jgi:acyl-CoA synthetase (AMP-forming)/AMP-acid ligase II